MATNPQEIQLSDEQKRQLAEAADRAGKPWPEVFSDALGAHRPPLQTGTDGGSNEQESLYDALKRDGLIGCIKGGPSDLSTNPKYMEGFGRDNDTSAD